MFQKPSLLILFATAVLLTSCSSLKEKKDEQVKPPSVWTVQAGIENVPNHDGVCGKIGEYIVVRAQ